MNFDELYIHLKQNKSVLGLEIIQKNVPIGKKDGAVCYVPKEVIKINLNIVNDNSLDFMDDLGRNFVFEIGDTFYRKSGSSFKYDYYRSSNDYHNNLSEMVDEGFIYVMTREGLTNGC